MNILKDKVHLKHKRRDVGWEGFVNGKTFNEDFLSYSNLSSCEEKNFFWPQKFFLRFTKSFS